MTFTITPATPDDFAAMYLISMRTHQQNYDDLIPKDRRADYDKRYSVTPENQAKYTAKFQRYLDDDRWFVWVAKDETGNVVGYTLAFKENDHLLHNKSLFISPDHQGQGIGPALLKESLTPIQTGEIYLTVIKDNTWAKHIYEKNGFKPTGVDPKSYYGSKREVMRLEKQ